LIVLSLSLIGGFRAHLGPRPLALSRKAQALLAYLALAPGEPHPRGRLAGLLWGDGANEHVRKRLGQTLSELRRALGPRSEDYIAVDDDWVELCAADLQVDVAALRRLAAEGNMAALREAAVLCRGEFLEGLSLPEPTFEAWLIGERARVHGLAVQVLSALLARQVAENDAAGAIETGLRALALDPLCEHIHRAIMRIYAGQGRRDEALRQYQTCVDALRRDLGVEPDAETRQLQQEIASQSTWPG
jgi:DNA-binding SARP family transcriptional activator